MICSLESKKVYEELKNNNLKYVSQIDVSFSRLHKEEQMYNVLMIYYCFNGTVLLANHGRPPEKPERIFGLLPNINAGFETGTSGQIHTQSV